MEENKSLFQSIEDTMQMMVELGFFANDPVCNGVLQEDSRMRRIYADLMSIYPVGDGFSYDDFCYCVKELRESGVKSPSDHSIKVWVSNEIERLMASNRI